MPRIQGVDIPNDKFVYISLSYLYGVGPKVALRLCHQMGIDPCMKASQLSDDNIAKINNYLDREVLAEGPHGFVRKEDSLPELLTALRAVATGARHVSPWAAQLMPPKTDDTLMMLTPLERAVLQMVAGGKQTKEISEALGSSMKTVEHHRQHLRDKLGLHDVASLTRLAIRHGMLEA